VAKGKEMVKIGYDETIRVLSENQGNRQST